MAEREVMLCAPVRTAIATWGGSLNGVAAPEIGATAVSASLDRSGLDADAVDGVVLGHVIQAGTKMNPARQAAMHGGLGEDVPAVTVNRVCGSGAQAVVSAAQAIRAGDAGCMIAGGMENMDRAPYLDMDGRWGRRMGPAKLLDSMLTDGLHDAFSDQHSGWHTEDLASRYDVDRASQDAWAARSQQRFAAAQQRGDFAGEIAPVAVRRRRETVSFDVDEHNRADTIEEGLAKLRPAFRPDGTITPGNAPGLNSAAAAMVVAERERARTLGLQPMARLAGYGVAAVEPGMFGIAPVPAVQRALEHAGWSSDDVERIEINEAFAAIAVACHRELGLAEDIVNVDGGAIAHGHPIGATGAILTTRLLHSMARDGLRRGVVTLCIGGGQGIALALERDGG